MSAIFSECGMYRYRLDRQIGDALKTVAFIGINPSIANEVDNDKTVNRMLSFAKGNGAGKVIVANVFSLISTDINGLRADIPLRGDEHDFHFRKIIGEADILVPCWGSREKLRASSGKLLDDCMNLLLSTGKPVLCLGKTKSGKDPLHPQRLPSGTKLKEWALDE
ncbi:hypothetical protein C3Z09_15215 [Lelliottia aquatilis]|uniref:DUF1643 domain-containing protein n=1 Tax=Lelliottia aquatilis TaxID=2080838 RepID=UPI000CDEA630|nr:DUF1643 domain-containing protein [Lelliottia aquatilis]POZ15035.1 hypothetical protein C3Z09_15215 [Lelliottia aquatilis]